MTSDCLYLAKMEYEILSNLPVTHYSIVTDDERRHIEDVLDRCAETCVGGDINGNEYELFGDDVYVDYHRIPDEAVGFMKENFPTGEFSIISFFENEFNEGLLDDSENADEEEENEDGGNDEY